MNQFIGFSLYASLQPHEADRAAAARQDLLAYFPCLELKSMAIGQTRLELWGHPGASDQALHLEDGSLLVLIGSKQDRDSLKKVGERLLLGERGAQLTIPWEGRYILLWLAADGASWTMWNDWCGSIPVYYTSRGSGRIVSTIEPIAVAAAGFSAADIFMPGLATLFINGHFVSNWTLFEGLKIAQPDAATTWRRDGKVTFTCLNSIMPTSFHWETGWDDLVDEMHDLTREAVASQLKTQPTWLIPLSAGLDSRLIAAIGAEIGADLHTFTYGSPQSTDVIYAREIARELGLPWRHVELPRDFLPQETLRWAAMFGSSLHFHGMYQASFLEQLRDAPAAPLMTGFLGDVLAGVATKMMTTIHATAGLPQIESDWYLHWSRDELKTLMKVDLTPHIQRLGEEIRLEIDENPGAWFQKLNFLVLWNRQRRFTNFQTNMADYWRGTAAPFINRKYARFSFSLPRAALDNRRLLGDVFRRYYGPLAVIPGTYADMPLIPTGRYLLKKRVASRLPVALQRGPFKGFRDIQLRMTMASVRAQGKSSLWPIYDAWPQLRCWLEVDQIDPLYQSILDSTEDIRPLRKLQSIQTLAYRLL